MTKVTYNKLVRNKIPKIIREQNEGFISWHKISDDEEYAEKLADKLVEESLELQEAMYSNSINAEDRKIEELADILLVVWSLLIVDLKLSFKAFKCFVTKNIKKGTFSHRVYLSSVNKKS